MIFACHVTLQDHLTKRLNNFIVKSSSRYVITQPGLVAGSTLMVKIKLFSFVT